MQSKLRIFAVFFLVVSFAAGLMLGGCGSGGGGGSNDLGSGSSGASGNVALLVADDPADDYEEITICVSKVSLIPADQNPHQSPVVIYESDDCYDINLLDLRDEDFLLTVKKRIPAGRYSKIRLEVEEIYAVGGTCDRFKLPSGRIDLNPRGKFEVKPGETLAIRLDIDANKSINLHQAGKSGKCIFRPVVFVDIDTITSPRRCPRILRGEIKRLFPSENDIEGFVLDLGGSRGLIDVLLSDNPEKLTVIFGEDGTRVRRTELEVGQTVRVTGKITRKGDLLASVVVIGNVLSVKGTVVSAVDDDSIFPLLLDDGQELIGGQVKVEITNATFVLLGCDQEVDPVAIQRGKRARVVGKFDVGTGMLRAVAVFLQSQKIVGDLTEIGRATGGTNLFITDEDGVDRIIFLPQDTLIYLQGDGAIPLGLLNRIVMNCEPKKVVVTLDPEATEPTAREVRVQQERLYGRVVRIIPSERAVILDSASGRMKVRIQEGATILLNTKRADVPVDFDGIRFGDELTLYGLEACEALDFDFYAFIVLINESSTGCDDHDCGDDDDDDDDH